MTNVKDITDASQKKQALIEIIYGKINDLLGGGATGQLFCMEFPSRPLNHQLYEYDTDSRSSVISKPFSVADAEFRLTDDLFNVAPIVQGPTGKKLSITFLQLINNYVPRLKEVHDFIVDKNHIRQWLLSDVDDTVDGKPFRGTRMELCKQLYANYLTAKATWEQEKSARYETDKAKSDLDHFADWLSREALVKDQGLNNLFNDAVVRGYYHEVLSFLGFLNVCSSAEALETTKQNARNSSRRSLDESMDVLPVQLQPNNWFKAMRPNLSPKDLTMATDLVIEQYKAKLAELEGLKAYLVQLKSNNVDKEDVEAAARQLEEGKRRFQEAESALIQQHGNALVSLFKVYLNATTGGKAMELKAAKAPTAEDPIAKKLGLASDVAASMLKTYQDQQAYLEGAERLAQLRARLVDTSAHDYQAEITRTTQRMEALQADIRYLEGLAGGVLAPGTAPAELSLLPANGNDAVGEGMFMDVILSETDSAAASATTSTSQASNSNWKVSGWFCSVGGQSASAMASSSVESAALSNEFKIGFRVAKVSIDRGGWFNPTIFEMSSNFQRVAQGMRASPSNNDEQLSKAAIMEHVNAEATRPGSLAQLLRSKDTKIPYMLPAYPVGFVIAKDITIRIKTTDSNDSITKALSESSASSGGGFLCFSASRASSAKSTSESAYHGAHAGYYYIRIPGPQILGWFLQLTPNDNATQYEALEETSVAQLQRSISTALLMSGSEADEHVPQVLEHRSSAAVVSSNL